jgi:hypothetical protein
LTEYGGVTFILGETIAETDWDASYSSFSSAIDDVIDWLTFGNYGLPVDGLLYSTKLLLIPFAPNSLLAEIDGFECDCDDKSDLL